MKRNLTFDLPIFLTILLRGATAFAAGDPMATTNFQSNPFQGVCQDVALLSNADYTRNKEFWDSAVTCGAPIQVLPQAGFEGFMLNMVNKLGNPADQTNAKDFLASVGKETLDRLDFDNKVTEVDIHCAQHDDAWFQQKAADAKAADAGKSNVAKLDADLYDAGRCPARLAKLRADIAKDGPSMRMGLAKMKLTAGLTSAAGMSLQQLMKLPGDSVPLTAQEQQKVDAEYKATYAKRHDALLKEGMAAIPKLQELIKEAGPLGDPATIIDPSIPSWVGQWYKNGGGRSDSDAANQFLDNQVHIEMGRSDFSDAQTQYLGARNTTRVLAYLKSANPSDDDIREAAAHVLKNGQAERKRTEALLADKYIDPDTGVAQQLTDNDRLNKMLGLMKNGPAVSDVLKQHPEFCHSAVGLTNYASHLGTRDGIASLAGMAAIGLLTGGVGFVAGGTAAGAVSIASAGAISYYQINNDYKAYSLARQRDFSYVDGTADSPDAGKEIAASTEFDDAKNSLAIDSALLVGMTAVSGGSAAAKYLLKDSAAALSTPAVIGQLQSKGISETEARNMINDLGSSNVAKAQAAVTRLSAALGESGADKDLLKAIVDKNMLSPEARDQVQMLRSQIAHLPKEDRQQVYDQMKAVISQIDPDKVVPKRSDAMAVAFAASKFGVNDPAAVASKINSWDEGLNSLAATYEQAQANMALPEIQKLGSQAERQQAAFDKALSDAGVSDPAQRASMTSCALPGAH